jgi:hypothetical protein
MSIDLAELAVRYLQTLAPKNGRADPAISLAVLLSDDEQIRECVANGPPLSDEFALALAEVLSPIELATLLQDLRFGRYLAADTFAAMCARAYDGCNDIRTLWLLGLAAVHFLGHKPPWPIVSIPAELPGRLLAAAADIDARMVGLKLLRRVGPREDAFARSFEAMQSRFAMERCGGSHELLQLLDVPDVLAKEMSEKAEALARDMAANDPDQNCRSNARCLLALLNLDP